MRRHRRRLRRIVAALVTGLAIMAPPAHATMADNLRAQFAEKGTNANFSGNTPTVFDLPDGRNPSPDLAVGKSASAKSYYNSTYSPSKAVDGNSSTWWRSTASYDYWRVDLGSVQRVDRVTVNWHDAYSSSYAIRTSPDGSAWTTIATGTASGPGRRTVTFEPRDVRHLLLAPGAGTAPLGYVGVRDFEVRSGNGLPAPQKVFQCGTGPKTLSDGTRTPTCDGDTFEPLQRRWDAVYMPDYFNVPVEGSDFPAVIYDHINDTTCEFWKMQWNYSNSYVSFPDAWSGRWGGCSKNSTFNIVAGVRGWETPTEDGMKIYYGVQGSGIAHAPTRWKAVEAGVADHPIQLVIPRPCGYTQVKPPATRSDGSYFTDCIPYGQRFSLPADLNPNVEGVQTAEDLRQNTRWCFPGRLYNDPTDNPDKGWYWIGRTEEQALALGWNGTNCPNPPLVNVVIRSIQAHGAVVTDRTNNDISFRFEGWKRAYAPWSPNSAAITNPYPAKMGCDGNNDTGQYNMAPVTDWERDCAWFEWSVARLPWGLMSDVN